MSSKMSPPASPKNTGFQGTQAVVTGSSSGIGRVTAIELARAGVTGLGVHYRENRAGAEETAALAQTAASGDLEIEILQADFAKPSDLSRLVPDAFERFSNLQTWINLSGGDVLTGTMADADFQTKLDYLWQVDVRATIELSRQVASRLRAAKLQAPKLRTECSLDRPASMVFVGWDQATRGMEGDAGQLFCTIKAAIMAFANSMAQEFAPEVRINTVAPGWIQTAWAQEASEYWYQRAQGQSLMGHWGTPEDVAAAILYAANPDHPFVTCQTIEVNGGWNRCFPKKPSET